MNAKTELDMALAGAALLVDAGKIWEDESGELWEDTFVGWVNIHVMADKEESREETHWQFYELALTALFVSGELHVHETALLVECSDGVKRLNVTKV